MNKIVACRKNISVYKNFLIGFLFAFLLSITHFSYAAQNMVFCDAIWLAQQNKIIKISASDGHILRQIDVTEKVSALALDKQRAKVWAVLSNKLVSYDFAANKISEFLLLDIDEYNHSSGYYDYSESEKYKLIVDELNGSLWLYKNNNIWHLSENGDLLRQITINNEIESIALISANDQIWVATEYAINIYRQSDGQQIQQVSVPGDIETIAYDKSLNNIWVAAESTLLRYNLDGELQYQQTIYDVELIVPDHNGKLWLATEHTLYNQDASGIRLFQMSPFGGYDDEIEVMFLEPANQSVWVSNEEEIIHVDNQSQILQRITLNDKSKEQVLYKDIFPPQLRFISPASGSYQNIARPLLQLEYSDDGIGVDTSSLVIQQDGLTITFDCQHNALQSNCRPTRDLTEGLTDLSAIISDYNGNASLPALTSFTTDTIRPVITVLSHRNGAYVNQEQQNITGHLSEFSTFTVNSTSILLGLNHAFSVPVQLIEGRNEFVLTAQDPAGNGSMELWVLNLDTVPPVAAQADKLSISEVSSGKTTVTGQAGAVEAGSIIEIVNLTTSITMTTLVANDGSFTLNISANPGDELQITVIDQAGNRSPFTRINVPLPLKINITYPVEGSVINSDVVNVEGTFSGPSNAGIAVNGQVAAIHNGKFYLNNLAVMQGENTIKANLATSAGHSSTDSITVTGEGLSKYKMFFDEYFGMSPFTTNLYIFDTEPTSIKEIKVDLETDGVYESIIKDAGSSLPLRYQAPGLYQTTIVITDQNSSIYTYQYNIVIYDIKILDVILQSVYKNMLSDLSSGNIEKAMQALTGVMRKKFKESFYLNQSNLAQIINKLGTISGGMINNEMAEYVITRQENSKQVAFSVYMIKGHDGVWRIGEM